MKGFIRNVLLDILVLWPAIFICLFDFKYSGYAENLLSFYGIFGLIAGVIISLAADKIVEESTLEKVQPKVRSIYSGASCLVEVLIFASLGWFWVASGVMVACIASISINDKIRAKFK